jgi:hypothetical protein
MYLTYDAFSKSILTIDGFVSAKSRKMIVNSVIKAEAGIGYTFKKGGGFF